MERTTFADPPQRFEAGSPNVAQAVGLAAAVQYLERVGMPAVAAHEHVLTEYALAALAEAPGVRIIGPTTATGRGGAVSFTVDGLHPHDVGQVLDDEGIAVRVGHHCAWPTCRRFDVPATTRASFGLYNQPFEVDLLRGRHPPGPAVLRGRLMDDLYQEIILDHYRHPVGRGLREPFEAQVHHVNPTCGDEITLRVHLEGAGESATVADISYESQGCSISQASASVMHELLVGHTVAEAMGTQEAFLGAHEVGHGRRLATPTRTSSATPSRSAGWRSTRHG